ncbi:hypothetical protein GCM10010185_72010 [Saccharothrix coeruleofusca]|uniref:Uncharacterized protein n=1 Tax=Saccharothrix coeruleofusca TaxID=33919 RepID=A0A918EHC7_9PSEU|nr:hypothetical protein GCM10010185_72010 [Saccharothrix coeruleofusca]
MGGVRTTHRDRIRSCAATASGGPPVLIAFFGEFRLPLAEHWMIHGLVSGNRNGGPSVHSGVTVESGPIHWTVVDMVLPLVAVTESEAFTDVGLRCASIVKFLDHPEFIGTGIARRSESRAGSP